MSRFRMTRGRGRASWDARPFRSGPTCPGIPGPALNCRRKDVSGVPRGTPVVRPRAYADPWREHAAPNRAASRGGDPPVVADLLPVIVTGGSTADGSVCAGDPGGDARRPSR